MDSTPQQKRSQLYSARLYVSYTLDLAVLAAFTPFGQELEFVFESHPGAIEALDIDPDWEDDMDIASSLQDKCRLGWLIGAQRPVVESGGVAVLSAMHWFYGDVYEDALQKAIDWANEAAK